MGSRELKGGSSLLVGRLIPVCSWASSPIIYWWNLLILMTILWVDHSARHLLIFIASDLWFLFCSFRGMDVFPSYTHMQLRQPRNNQQLHHGSVCTLLQELQKHISNKNPTSDMKELTHIAWCSRSILGIVWSSHPGDP